MGSLFADAFPNALPADGTSTSGILVTVADAAGNVVVGDHVHFSVGLEEGTGRCGTLSSTDKTTDANGQVRVTYTVSKDNVACWVMAVEAGGGQSAQSVIYQGSTQNDADTLKATFPTSLKAGGPPTTFTITAANPTAQPVPNAALDFVIFPGNSKSANVHASQVHLSYSTTGPTGAFSDVPLSGSTANGDYIEAYIGPAAGQHPGPQVLPDLHPPGQPRLQRARLQPAGQFRGLPRANQHRRRVRCHRGRHPRHRHHRTRHVGRRSEPGLVRAHRSWRCGDSRRSRLAAVAATPWAPPNSDTTGGMIVTARRREH